MGKSVLGLIILSGLLSTSYLLADTYPSGEGETPPMLTSDDPTVNPISGMYPNEPIAAGSTNCGGVCTYSSQCATGCPECAKQNNSDNEKKCLLKNVTASCGATCTTGGTNGCPAACPKCPSDKLKCSP